MKTSRRGFMRLCGAAGVATLLAPAMALERPPVRRKYHLSVSVDALQADPDLLELIHEAGVTDVWIAGFLYGHWGDYSLEKSQPWRERIEKLGMAAHIINLPLGHPGDSLGAKSGHVPLTPPPHWRSALDWEGKVFVGTSLHPPATAENCEAVRCIQTAGFKRVFLDDDFRLARGPGRIGGCFCAEHKQEFLRRSGYGEGQWQQLLEAIKHREMTTELQAWIEFICDQLRDCFRAQQAAAPALQLGIMVMYLGAEKAGIRLSDYHDVPFRVGEMMFNDRQFAPVKGKTDELFSTLFHRRFARPELAFSETTAYPANQLSARNMAAKLAVSTICDVRNTMYMSGLTAFPRTHWQTLGPAMKRHAELHSLIAGCTPQGPLKHYWGKASRFVGEDNPYSLFLALGIPFEVTSEPAKDGFTFLSAADARAASHLQSPGTVFIAKPQPGLPDSIRALPEALPDLFAWKREILPQLKQVPYIENETPVVCAWYPDARAVLLWNLSESRQELTLCFHGTRRPVSIDGLDVTLLTEINP